MQQILNKELKHYYKDIKKVLICDKKTKLRIIDSLDNDIKAKISDSSITTIDDVRKIFGTPEQIATNYQIEDVKNLHNTKRFIIKAVLIALSIIVLIVLAYFAFVLISDLISGNGYVEVDVRDTSQKINVYN